LVALIDALDAAERDLAVWHGKTITALGMGHDTNAGQAHAAIGALFATIAQLEASLAAAKDRTDALESGGRVLLRSHEMLLEKADVDAADLARVTADRDRIRNAVIAFAADLQSDAEAFGHNSRLAAEIRKRVDP
jgi:hypothetical protein